MEGAAAVLPSWGGVSVLRIMLPNLKCDYQSDRSFVQSSLDKDDC